MKFASTDYIWNAADSEKWAQEYLRVAEMLQNPPTKTKYILQRIGWRNLK